MESSVVGKWDATKAGNLVVELGVVAVEKMAADSADKLADYSGCEKVE